MRITRAAVLLMLLIGCQDKSGADTANHDQRALETQTLRTTLSLLDERGLSFDEAPADADTSGMTERAKLELQATLQTEIELERRRVNKAAPPAADQSATLALLSGMQEAVSQGHLAEFIRRQPPAAAGQPNQLTLLVAALEDATKKTLQRRLEHLASP